MQSIDSKLEHNELLIPPGNIFARAQGGPYLPADATQNARVVFESIYGIKFSKLTGYVGKNKLMPWQGAMTWIYEDKGAIFPQIQLRSPSTEPLVHEMVHYARAAFPTSKYEEHLAYMTAKAKWKQFVGPMFRHPRDASIVLSLVLLGDIGAFFGNAYALCIPLLYSASLFSRSLFEHFTMLKCKRKLSKLYGKPDRILIQLTDEEIEAFARKPKKDIKEYIDCSSCPRWQQIKAAACAASD